MHRTGASDLMRGLGKVSLRKMTFKELKKKSESARGSVEHCPQKEPEKQRPPGRGDPGVFEKLREEL